MGLVFRQAQLRRFSSTLRDWLVLVGGGLLQGLLRQVADWGPARQCFLIAGWTAYETISRPVHTAAMEGRAPAELTGGG